MKRERSFHTFKMRLEKVGLRKEVEARSLALHVTLQQLYEDGALVPSVITARRSIYTWLNRKKGIREIARLFDRSASGVSMMLRGDR